MKLYAMSNIPLDVELQVKNNSQEKLKRSFTVQKQIIPPKDKHPNLLLPD